MADIFGFELYVDDRSASKDWQRFYGEEMQGVRPGHSINIFRNKEFASAKLDHPTDGWLDFPWIIQCSPSSNEITESQQIELARKMRDVLQAQGCTVVVAANFENEL